MIIKIKRQQNRSSIPYWDTFEMDFPGRLTVSAVLDALNFRDNLVDVYGNDCRRITWEYSCMQKMCGGCAMVINHVPALACATFIDPVSVKKLVLEPLSKFPVICDLLIDRSIINEHQKQAGMYLGKRNNDSCEISLQYQTAKCLKCGLCLEVCPNYTGDDGGRFFGAVLANEAFLLHSSTENRKEEILREYRKHFVGGCSKSLACRDICPMKIPTLSSVGYLNRK